MHFSRSNHLKVKFAKNPFKCKIPEKNQFKGKFLETFKDLANVKVCSVVLEKHPCKHEAAVSRCGSRLNLSEKSFEIFQY